MVAVHTPYIIKENASLKGQNPMDYIVAEWTTKHDRFSVQHRSELDHFLTHHQHDTLPTGEFWIGKTRFYDPFKIPKENLLSAVMKINFDCYSDISAFCNNYGTATQSFMALDGSDYLKHHAFSGTAESIMEFRLALELIPIIVDIYTEFINTIALGKKENGNYGTVKQMQDRIIDVINFALKKYPVFQSVAFHDEFFYPTYVASCLAGAVWYRLYETITKRQEIKKCLFCRDWFIPSQSNQRFCPDTINPGSHSRCANSYNQMKHRAKRWFSNQEKTIEQIALRYGRSITEVESWVKE